VSRTPAAARGDGTLAWLLAAPALTVMLLIVGVPLVATLWESLHGHDLRLPWLGRPFAGLDNFVEAAGDARFRAAVAHTLVFASVTVPVELAAGLGLALMMHAVQRGRGLVRVTALLPWAVPTVVTALIWRFMFDAQAGIVTDTARRAGLIGPAFDWFVQPVAAWVPIALADIWKTAPFVAIVLLAGLHAIDPAIDEAAQIDGAGPVRRFATMTLPLLAPALVVAATLRLLDALRLFDLVYVLTGGGPGSATEPMSLYAFTVLTQRLRFGYGSALSIAVFLIALVVAWGAVRALSRAHGERA
jgi:ABC-type sugar transport system permease subunit